VKCIDKGFLKFEFGVLDWDEIQDNKTLMQISYKLLGILSYSYLRVLKMRES
jgi:hypothetical protein